MRHCSRVRVCGAACGFLGCPQLGSGGAVGSLAFTQVRRGLDLYHEPRQRCLLRRHSMHARSFLKNMRSHWRKISHSNIFRRPILLLRSHSFMTSNPSATICEKIKEAQRQKRNAKLEDHIIMTWHLTAHRKSSGVYDGAMKRVYVLSGIVTQTLYGLNHRCPKGCWYANAQTPKDSLLLLSSHANHVKLDTA